MQKWVQDELDKRFIPSPRKWLHGERWNDIFDEVEETTPAFVFEQDTSNEEEQANEIS
jgi:hypothetical protein